MANIRHSGGIVEAVLELGFDQVRYFEGAIGLSATNISINPPARRLIINNVGGSGNIFLRINDDNDATTSVSLLPGKDIKVRSGAQFAMDFDALHKISIVADTTSVSIEGVLGFKGTIG